MKAARAQEIMERAVTGGLEELGPSNSELPSHLSEPICHSSERKELGRSLVLPEQNVEPQDNPKRELFHKDADINHCSLFRTYMPTPGANTGLSLAHKHGLRRRAAQPETMPSRLITPGENYDCLTI